MRKNTKIYGLLLAGWALTFSSCKKDFGDLNGPTVQAFTTNATVAELNNLVSGTESGLRNNLALYLDDVGIIGREMYHFSNSEPRYVTDLLGASGATLSGSNFYITNTWASRYQVVKNCNILEQAASSSSLISAQEVSGYVGFAQMIKAYQLLLCLNQTDSNGIRIDVSDPNNLGPFVQPSAALTAIAALLDSAQTAFSTATIDYTLAGFGNFSDGPGLLQVDQALAARVAVYQQNWAGALSSAPAAGISSMRSSSRRIRRGRYGWRTLHMPRILRRGTNVSVRQRCGLLLPLLTGSAATGMFGTILRARRPFRLSGMRS